MRKIFPILLMSLGSIGVKAQGGLIISPSAYMVCSGSPSIVVTDGKWENNGTFTPATSLVRMEGAAPTASSTIGGTVVTTFYNFTQQKSANDLLLNQDIGVTNNFTMNGGLFQLNNNIVTLGSATGQIVNESETNRITGTTGGEVWKTMVLTTPAAVNPGNMGAEITSAANLGSTEIHRGHVQQTDGGTGLSIERYYDIMPTNNFGLAATLRQYYFDAELAGRVESELEHFNSTDAGLSWYDRGFTARNMVTNYVDNSAYDDFSIRWTLASPLNQPLPASWLTQGLRCEQDEAILYWTVSEPTGSDYFQIEKSENLTDWTELAGGRIPSRGAGTHSYDFALTESSDFFRVRQVESNGDITVSEAHRLTCGIGGYWVVWPTPTADVLHIRAASGNSIRAFEIVNLSGQVLLSQPMTDPGVSLCSLTLDDKLPAAIYLLRIFPENGEIIHRKFEVLSW